MIRPESRTVAQDLQKLRKKKREEKKNTGYNVTGTDEESTGPVDELFKFIGCDPNKAVSKEQGKTKLFSTLTPCRQHEVPP